MSSGQTPPSTPPMLPLDSDTTRCATRKPSERVAAVHALTAVTRSPAARFQDSIAFAVFNPWVKPGPKAHAYLLFGFSLARANARMPINADSKRRSARNSVRASRPQSTSSVAVHG